MQQEQNRFSENSPSAAEMQDYINRLDGNLKTGSLEGTGWFVSMTSNEQGSNNPTVTLSKKDGRGDITDQTVSWQEFKSWQELS